MAEPTLEERVAALEQEVAALKGKAETPAAKDMGWVERWAGVFKDNKAFKQVVEYGRYFRKTGREAPPDWKPGDPIPEPDRDDAP